MLQIILVDDETAIREGLAKIICKESKDFIVVGTFANGHEALKFVQQNKVDVVITDIRMPLVDGLSLMKQLKEIQPEIRCIIMSGFTEFEYARQAIRYSAVDYLLKPINKRQLLSLLYTLNNEKEASLHHDQKYRSGIMLSYLTSPLHLCSKLPRLELELPYFAVHVLRGSDQHLLREAVYDLPNTVSEPLDIIETEDGLLVVVSYYPEEPSTLSIQQLANVLRYQPKCARTVHIGSSRCYTQINQLGIAYHEALEACDQGIYSHSSWCYHYYSELPEKSFNWNRIASSTREILVNHLQILQLNQLAKELEALFEQLKAMRATRQEIQSVCEFIWEASASFISEWRSSESTYIEKCRFLLKSSMSFEEIKRCFLTELLNELAEVRTQRINSTDHSVETIKRWIEKHYDQQTDLTSLANMVYLTPSYLSKLFKHETGITITDYIIKVRIRQAKQLLITCPNKKIHEIGCQVGYPDPAYFNKLFKRIVGITPNEYKRINQVQY